MYTIYAASCTETGGVYQLCSETGEKWEETSFAAVVYPGYMARYENHLFVLSERYKIGDGSDQIFSFSIKENGLSPSGKGWLTGGAAACHLVVSPDGGKIYCANYLSSNIACLEKNTLRIHQHVGASIDPQRQAAPHPHQAVVTPDGQYICVVDLGLDAIILYDTDLFFHGKVCMDAGSGPRHLVFSPDGRYAYCANELSSTVTALEYANGALYKKKSYSVFPGRGGAVPNQTAAIRITNDGKHLFVSNRGQDLISHFAVCGSTLEFIENVSCGGLWPRDIFLTGDEKILLCANEKSDTIVALPFESGRLCPAAGSCRINSPAALLEKL